MPALHPLAEQEVNQEDRSESEGTGNSGRNQSPYRVEEN
jgi:hypothetical protein